MRTQSDILHAREGNAMEFDDEIREHVGHVLKFTAQSRDITQKQLAERMGLSTSTISKIWSGSVKKPTHYEAMASELGFELRELMASVGAGSEGDASAESREVAEVIALEDAQSPEEDQGALSGACHVITIAARKGGTAKTTSSVHLGGALARRGFRVLLVDLDGQCDATEWLLPEEIDVGLSADDVLRHGQDALEAIYPSLVEGLDVLPATPPMDSIEAAMAGEWGMERRLRELMEPVRARYDFVLFDCPGTMDFRVVSALMSSDWVIIPTSASTLDLKGAINFIPQVLKYADPVRFNPDLQFLGILLSRVQRNTVLSRDAQEWLGEEFEELVFEHKVHASIRYKELPGYQALIFDHAPEWAEDYEGVTREVLERLGLEVAAGARAGRGG